MRTQLLPAILFLFFTYSANAQEKVPVKFGKVAPSDFEIKDIKVDTAEGAVIIADVGQSAFEGNSDGWFNLVYKVYRRVLVLDKKGFDIANVEIPLYTSKDGSKEEKLEKLKAYTYNLEGGKVIETKLSDDAIFKEKKSSHYILKKFTMPALKPGSIIEYSYTINSPFLFNLQPWTFQGGYPRIWSEYNVEMPDFFEYMSSAQGFLNFDIKDEKSETQIFRIRIPGNIGERDETANLTTTVNKFRWVIKNVPALKEEEYTSSIENYISKIEFQKSANKFPERPREDVMGNWYTAGKSLMENESFGEGLKKANNWLDGDMRDITKGATDDIGKAMKIFDFVQASVKNLGRGGIYLNKPAKDVYKSKSGYAQEINLLLATMMNHEHIEACPVLISTLSNGHVNPYYPLIDQYNYVICMVTIDGKNYFLDASQPYLGFGKLPAYVYNGHARAINEALTDLNFMTDTLSESKVTSLILFNDEKTPGKWTGNYVTNYGYNESSTLRRYILDKGKSALEKDIKEDFTGEYSIDEFEIEGENDKNSNLQIHYKLNIEISSESPEIIYFNPIIHAGYKTNPFKSADRKYPVEMPYLTDRVYVLKLPIPQGYIVDEVPKSEKVTFNDTEGLFEYLVSKTDTDINLRVRLKIDKATFLPEDYEYLRAFFDHIVKKYAENIVFKKKK